MEKLQYLIQKAVTPFHAVEAVKEALLRNDFEELNLGNAWELERGKAYVTTQYGTSLFAFVIGETFGKEDGIRMAAAHSDFPGFRIKPNPDMKKEAYLFVNTEAYGGVNLSSWCDRPLSAAGRVALKSEDVFAPKMQLVDLNKPIFTIPNVAIHLNREMNKGTELKKQTHMLPLAGMAGSEGFLAYLAKELEVSECDILDYELYLYNMDEPKQIGMQEEFLSAPRLDDLTSVQALLEGITESKRDKGINLIAIFDNEEIGSRTKQGAASLGLAQLLEKIYISLGMTGQDYRDAIERSMLVSADVSQGYHPSYGEKYDPTNHNCLNQGFSIKQAASQSYATDSEAVAIVKQICEKEGVAYQTFANHSDEAGGGTLGSIASALVPVRTVDIGVPLLAMHSARETIGVSDQKSLTAFIKAYFSL